MANQCCGVCEDGLTEEHIKHGIVKHAPEHPSGDPFTGYAVVLCNEALIGGDIVAVGGVVLQHEVMYDQIVQYDYTGQLLGHIPDLAMGRAVADVIDDCIVRLSLLISNQAVDGAHVEMGRKLGIAGGDAAIVIEGNIGVLGEVG
jgi:hypothetical protein